jgi:transcriptional regulator with XRE-family HTH domain
MSKKPLPVDLLVGRNIRICRLQRGLTQTALGDHLGVTFQQIQKYENGANRVGASRLNQIAGALQVSLTTLFDGRRKADHAGPDLSGRALLAHPHALRLVQAFHKIPGRKARQAVLRLIDSIGKEQSAFRSPLRGRRRSVKPSAKGPRVTALEPRQRLPRRAQAGRGRLH